MRSGALICRICGAIPEDGFSSLAEAVIWHIRNRHDSNPAGVEFE